MRRSRRVLALTVLAMVVASCTSHGHTANSTSVVSSVTSGSPPSSASRTSLPAPASQTLSSAPAAPPVSHTPTAPTTQARPAAAVGAERPCGVGGTPRYAHVVWIWMENKPYGSVIGSGSAPYENRLAKQCGLAGDYHGITHPSLPNYLAATGGSTFGVSDDSSPSAHPIGAASIFAQLDAAGLTWRSYEESMPRNCATSASGDYAVKHNPAAYYTGIRGACGANDVPLAGNLDHDIAAGTLPSFSFVTPNLCHDTHDCSVADGDAWLATWIPKILSGPNYRAGNTLVVLTWDEGVGSGNQIPTIVAGPTVPAGVVATTRFDHYALLRTTEDLLGLGHLGAAASAPTMASAFGL